MLSHLHVDHCVDLTTYHVVRTYNPGGPLPRLPVHGPRAASARIAAASGFSDRLGVDEVFDFVDWVENQAVRLGPFTITPTRVSHPVETYALRIEQGGRVFVYSGDTGPSTALVEAAKGADLFLCEASFLEGPDNPADLHLTGRQAGQHASRAEREPAAADPYPAMARPCAGPGRGGPGVPRQARADRAGCRLRDLTLCGPWLTLGGICGWPRLPNRG